MAISLYKIIPRAQMSAGKLYFSLARISGLIYSLVPHMVDANPTGLFKTFEIPKSPTLTNPSLDKKIFLPFKSL